MQEDDNSAEAVAAGLIGFTAGIALGAAMDNDYYYGPYGWHGGGYMYNDAWDDWYDDREDAREDWQDHREDMLDERGDRREDIADERGDRASDARSNSAPNVSRTRSSSGRAQASPEAAGAAEAQRSRRDGVGGPQHRRRASSRAATASGDKATRERSGTSSDAFSGYSSGKSERAASSRGKEQPQQLAQRREAPMRPQPELRPGGRRFACARPPCSRRRPAGRRHPHSERSHRRRTP